MQQPLTDALKSSYSEILQNSQGRFHCGYHFPVYYIIDMIQIFSERSHLFKNSNSLITEIIFL